MNALKEFVTNNKLLVSITGAVTMCAFMVFSIIAFAISGTGSVPANTETTTTSKLVAENNSESSADTTQPPYTGETGSYGEEGTEDESEEPTTKPRVDPDTLPYMIMVNRAANCLTVYAKDDNGKFTIPYKAITVSCGKELGDTPLGTYQTIESYDWRKMVDGTYAQHAYRIVGSILFHSVPYYTLGKNDLEWEEFNKLGTAASLGCVRMTVIDAKWLIDNCPIGTKVVIYDDLNNPGPLGKPDTIKIPADLYTSLGLDPANPADVAEADNLRKWDPTDPDNSNPWHKYYAVLSYPVSKQITVEVGTTIEQLREYFSATDTCGNDITEKIRFSETLDLDTSGVYRDITVSVTDAIGSHAETTFIIIVAEKEEEASSQDESSSNQNTSEIETTEPDSSEIETTEPDTSELETTEPDSSENDSTKPSESEPTSSSDTTTKPSESEPDSSSSSDSSKPGDTPMEPTPEESTTPAEVTP